jgi:hypothetical protein
METNGSNIMHNMQHQYIERDTGRLCTEMLCSDGFIQLLHSDFERQIRYWECRLMRQTPGIVVAPADHTYHPAATVALAMPLSKNRRGVTIIDTDVAYSSGVGLVAMPEVVALPS